MEARMSSEDIARQYWGFYLKAFTRRNHDRLTRIWVCGPDENTKEVESNLTLVGIGLERVGSDNVSLEISLSSRSRNDKKHTIKKPKRLMPIIGHRNIEDGIGAVSDDGTITLLLFEDLQNASSH